jgi:hypothetical protein
MENDSWSSVGGLQALDIIPHRSLEVGSVVSAQGELFAVLHDDPIFTMKPGLHYR